MAINQILLIFFVSAVILAGFEMDFTSVNESVGSFELCVRIFNDPASLPNHTEINFSLELLSTSGSASKMQLTVLGTLAIARYIFLTVNKSS